MQTFKIEDFKISDLLFCLYLFSLFHNLPFAGLKLRYFQFIRGISFNYQRLHKDSMRTRFELKT